MKYNSTCSQDHCKACPAVKAIIKNNAIENLEKFASVGKMNIVHLLVTQTAHLGCTLQQFHVKNVLFHAISTKKVMFMSP